MRTPRDRLRHALLFELVALLLVTPLGVLAFGVAPGAFGVVALVSSTLAMAFVYVYNLGFDHALRRLRGSLHKTLRLRLLHTVLFEAGLLCVLVPFIALYLQVPLHQALAMDVSLSVFYAVYGFGFNWAYDLVFPPPSLPDAG